MDYLGIADKIAGWEEAFQYLVIYLIFSLVSEVVKEVSKKNGPHRIVTGEKKKRLHTIWRTTCEPNEIHRRWPHKR